MHDRAVEQVEGQSYLPNLQFVDYRIYSIKPRPGRLLNFWTLRVGAYSRWAQNGSRRDDLGSFFTLKDIPILIYAQLFDWPA